ncbi:MAG: hypothetical protein ACOY3K_02065 [Candidatus Omnitrophota bacterium]
MRWILLDTIVAIEKGRCALSSATLPQAPYSTEILMLEMMAQTGGVLLGAESDFKKNVMFAKIEQSHFQLVGHAGASLQIHAASEQLREEGAWIDAKVTHREQILAEARLMLAVVPDLVPGLEKCFTFHEAFMEHYDVRNKIKRISGT